MMAIKGVADPIDMAVAGMQIESMRLKAISANIANAHVTDAGGGMPYRRRMVEITTEGSEAGGLSIGEIVEDTTTAFRTIRIPGHPQADKNGMVQMPNVDVPVELVQMVVAARSYQANAAMMKRYQDINKTTLELLS